MRKAVLIGDSIRRNYQPLVVNRLVGKVEVVGPWENCRHSLWALDHFQQWVGDEMAEIVHVNFGLHDTAVMADGHPQVVLEQYKLCVARFFERARDPLTTVIWATTTPRYKKNPDVPKSEWVKDESVDEYNAAALEIAKEAGVRVNDLHGLVMEQGWETCISDDGVHMTPQGYELLADAVADAVLQAG